MAKHCEVILYQEDAWEDNRIISVIQSKQSIKQYAFILHDKDVDENKNPKKLHFHVYLNFGSTNVQFKSVAQWFNVAENAVQRIESNKASLLQYYLHMNCPDKQQYSVDQMISNFDVMRYIAEKDQKSKLSDIVNACAEGTITPYNYQDFVDPVTYAKYEVQLKRAWAYADHHYATANNGQRNCGIIWVYGDSGMGKSTLCQLFAEEKKLAAYRSATGKDPFSDYAGQPVIVLDDLRANEPFTFPELLKAIDPNYNCPVQSRYRNKVLRASHIFVTSVFSPTNFTSQFDLRGNEAACSFIDVSRKCGMCSRTKLKFQNMTWA